MVDVLLRDVRIEVLALDEAEEELIDDLNVRPSDFEHRLIFFRVEGITLRIHWRRDGAEEIFAEHLDYSRVHWFGDDLSIVRNVIQQFVQSQALDFLGFHIAARIVEVEDDIALVNFLHEEVLATIGRHLMEARKLLEFALALV